jgi:bifunctional enzyme CysN/CysC
MATNILEKDLSSIELVRLATSGSVDDGKSTLIGRFLYDCNLLYKDQLEAVRKTSLKKGFSSIDFSLFLDGLSAEREQGITIDVAYRYFSTENRKFIVADVPGHEQYTRNMVTGASAAQMAVILVDARKGLLPQSKRHLFINSLLGVPHILIAINKMDLVDYRQEVFEKIKNDFKEFAARLAIADLQFLPLSATTGEMVVNRSDNMAWYQGRTLFDYLENVQITSNRNLIDFRFPVQLIIRPHQDLRGYAGLIESGTIKVGDEVTVLPSGQESKVKKIFLGFEEVESAFTPQSVAIVLEDELDISRGEMIIRRNNLPEMAKEIDATICWFSDKPLKEGNSYLLKHTSRLTRCFVDTLRHRINVETLHREEAKSLEENDIGRAVLKTNDYLMFDQYAKNRNTGGFVLIDEITNNTVGVGVITHKSPKVTLEAKKAMEEMAAEKIPAKKGAVLWFTGLSGSGKSTIADRLLVELEKQKVAVERLDGDIVRESLTKDLGFSKEDRDKNISRVAFVAKLLAKHGVLVLATFISPYRAQRQLVREQVDNFIEIFVDAPLEVCEKRDVKGLYQKARKGEIPNFTGVSDIYEEPKKPEIHLKTAEENTEEYVVQILDYLRKEGYLS